MLSADSVLNATPPPLLASLQPASQHGSQPTALNQMVPRTLYGTLPPRPVGISDTHMQILRGVIPEDTLQILLAFAIARSRDSSIYNIVDKGADITGIRDSTDAVQESVDTAIATNGIVYFPRGRYKISSTIIVDSVRGLELYGDGPQNTVFVWDGSSGQDMFRVKNAQLVRMHGFELFGNSNVLKRPRACLNSTFDYLGGTYSYVTALCRWDNIWCGGVSNSTGLPNMCQNGILINTINTDYNNSEHSFENIHIDGAQEAGIKISQTQAKTLKFYDCHINDSSKGVYCLNGAFAWYGGAINCIVADKSGIAFDIGAPNDPILIEGFQSEGTGRILRTGAGALTGAGWPVTLRNSRFSGDLANPDGVMIEFGARGPLVVEGNLLDSWSPVAGVPLQFKLTSSAGVMSCDIRNNDVSGTDTYLHSLVKDVAALGIREIGNVYYNTGVGSYFPRKHAGSIDFVAGDTTKTWTFDVPVHTGPASIQSYTIATSIAARAGGAVQQVLKVTKSTTGFDVTLTAVLGVGETLTVDWQLAWK